MKLNSMLPKITIITPSYNQGDYIEQTIKSILDQNYPNLEYIIIDGGSTDQTVDIIKKYEDKITYWVSEPDRGQAHAINKGLEKATGDIVNWINSDDYLEPSALRALAEAVIKNPKKQVFCGYTHCFWDEDKSTSHTYRMGLKKNTTATVFNVEMNQPGSFYKTEVLKQLGGVNESLNYVFDNELWMRFLCKYGQENVLLINNLIAHFRQHGNSKSFGDGFEEFHEEKKNILNWIVEKLPLPQYLVEKVAIENSLDRYCSNEWEFSYLSVTLFEALLSEKYMVTLYSEGKYKESKKCLKIAIKYNTINWDRKSLGLIKRLISNWSR
jgi:glycosyltransferase involved in cell wall biosynthesis